MPQIGPLEIMVVAAIALIVFGPQKLPEITRTVGRTLAQFRRMAEDVRSEFREGLTIPEEDRIRPPDERPEPERLTPAVRAVLPGSEDAVDAETTTTTDDPTNDIPADGATSSAPTAATEDAPTEDIDTADRSAAPDA